MESIFPTSWDDTPPFFHENSAAFENKQEDWHFNFATSAPYPGDQKKLTLNGKSPSTYASLLAAPEAEACDDFYNDAEDTSWPSDEHTFTSQAPNQLNDNFRGQYSLGQLDLPQWCESWGHTRLTSMPPPASQPFGASMDADMVEPDSSWGKTVFGATGNSISGWTDPSSDGLTPDLTDCSTPFSSLVAETSSRTPLTAGASFKTDSQRWHATVSRTRAADNVFLYGVLTTKVFCRPSCASRRPSRRHVRFFPFPGAIEAAEQAKLRPCKRCKPELLGTANTAVLGICQVLRTIIAETNKQGIAETKESLKLDSLAQSAGFSTFHFHRLFKATTQVTPGDFIQACRSFSLQDALGLENDPISGIKVGSAQLIPDSSCWSERTARKALGGISALDYAKGAPSRNIQYCCCDSPFGPASVAFSKDDHRAELNLHSILLGQDAEARIRLRFPYATLSIVDEDHVRHCLKDLEEKGTDRDSELTADILPTLWRARVWVKLVHH